MPEAGHVARLRGCVQCASSRSPITPALKGEGATGRANRLHNISASVCHAGCFGILRNVAT